MWRMIMMNEKNVCPACGCEMDELEEMCEECGLCFDCCECDDGDWD